MVKFGLWSQFLGPISWTALGTTFPQIKRTIEIFQEILKKYSWDKGKDHTPLLFKGGFKWVFKGSRWLVLLKRTSHIHPPANGQLAKQYYCFLLGLLEVFISETLILATASVRYEAINEKNNISIFFRKGEAIMWKPLHCGPSNGNTHFKSKQLFLANLWMENF